MFALFKSKKQKRVDYIKSYQFSKLLLSRWKSHYPQLSQEEEEKVQAALKEYFILYARNMDRGEVRKYGLAMPSKVADTLWHEFILMTKDYHNFCKNAFGQYLHHTPSEKEVTLDLRDKKLDPGLLNVYTLGASSAALLFGLDSTILDQEGYLYDLSNIEMQAKSRGAESSTGSSSGCGATGSLTIGDSSGDSSSCGSGSSCSGCGGGCG